MRSPKLSKDKKMAIAKECIENGKNYKETCIKYSNLYLWIDKYQDKIVKSSNYLEEDIVYVIRIKKKRFKNITKNIIHSMSRPGHCHDNSLIDSF